MAINAANATSSTSTTDTGALGRARLAENFDTFLSLLTTQLKNQDPLSPLDSNQFTQQIVQMTGVEQQLLTNDLLKKLVSNTGSGVATAVSLIGKDVRAEADTAALKDGKAEWTYKLDREASDVKLEVLNAAGNVVRAIAPTDNAAGEHTFTWDGKSAAGTPLAEGTYSLRITAKDSEGATVTSSTYADGRVTGVEQDSGSTYVTLNGVKVPWDQIISIREPADTTTAATGTTSSTDKTSDSTSPAAT